MSKIHPLRKERFFRGLTLDRLMILTGRAVDSTTLSRIERGIYLPTSEQKKAIARALRKPVKEIFLEK